MRSEATEELAERVRSMIGHKPGVTEKKMFGGYGFMLEYDVQLHFRRARTWSASFGDGRHDLRTLAGRLFGAVA